MNSTTADDVRAVARVCVGAGRLGAATSSVEPGALSFGAEWSTWIVPLELAAKPLPTEEPNRQTSLAEWLVRWTANGRSPARA
jgi:hypothetical protein